LDPTAEEPTFVTNIAKYQPNNLTKIVVRDLLLFGMTVLNANSPLYCKCTCE